MKNIPRTIGIAIQLLELTESGSFEMKISYKV